MVKISDCPFCGNSATLIRSPLWYESHGYHGCYEFFVKCLNKECEVTLPYGKFDTIYLSAEDAEKQAIDKWNDRKKETL